MVTLLKRLLPKRLTRLLVIKNAPPASPVRSLPPPTHSFFDDEFFNCHTVASFQRLFGSNNGHPETKPIPPLSAQHQPHARDMVTSARTASSKSMIALFQANTGVVSIGIVGGTDHGI
jgi:hypothetical protein